jgi:hypothetical protein
MRCGGDARAVLGRHRRLRRRTCASGVVHHEGRPWRSGADPVIAAGQPTSRVASTLPSARSAGARGTGGGDRVLKPLADPHRERPAIVLGELEDRSCSAAAFAHVRVSRGCRGQAIAIARNELVQAQFEAVLPC